MEYYTYAYLREDGTPYYIGKGRGKRIFDKSSRRSCPVPKDKKRIIYLKKNLNEEEAFKHEKYMIAVFGRRDLGTGILRNLTDGGEGFSSLQMKLFWEKRNKEKNKKIIRKRKRELKKWRIDYDKGAVWRENNREVFDDLIKNVINNRSFVYSNDTV
ncbi:MAG: hypothetical protein ACO23D_05830 [Candidatus Nanopelagicales bacterium]